MTTQTGFVPSHRRIGKVARLSKIQRELINKMLDDGVTYAAICKVMAQQGISLNTENLSNWQQGGYQDWRRLQLWREQVRAENAQFAQQPLPEFDPAKITDALMQVVVLEICRQLQDLGQAVLRLQASPNPEGFAHLTKNLTRLTREVLYLHNQQDNNAQLTALAENGAIPGQAQNVPVPVPNEHT